MGCYTYGDVVSFWLGAGGPGGSIADIAAAITVPESSACDVIQQGQPYATTGWGLWQITPGNSVPSCGVDNELLAPNTNACAALQKYIHAGNGGNNFTPWTSFNNGSYRRYLGGANWPRGASTGGGGGGTCESQVFQQGSTGPCVNTIQAALNQLIGCGLTVDGIFGPATRACVVSYQQSRGLGADGIVGPATWQRIDADLGAAGGSVSPGGGGPPPIGGIGVIPPGQVTFGIPFPPQAVDVAQLIPPGIQFPGQNELAAVNAYRNGYSTMVLPAIVNAINNAIRGR